MTKQCLVIFKKSLESNTNDDVTKICYKLKSKINLIEKWKINKKIDQSLLFYILQFQFLSEKSI